jgi:hypothetical protein
MTENILVKVFEMGDAEERPPLELPLSPNLVEYADAIAGDHWTGRPIRRSA